MHRRKATWPDSSEGESKARRNPRPVTKKLLFIVALFLLCPVYVIAAPAGPKAASLASAPTDLVGTYFYYDRRDHGYAFHLQLEPDGTAFYIEQAEDGNLVRKGSWSANGDTVTVKLAEETKTLSKDAYGQLIENRSDGDHRFFANIRRASQP